MTIEMVKYAINFYMATSMKEFDKSAFGKLNVTLKFSE